MLTEILKFLGVETLNEGSVRIVRLKNGKYEVQNLVRLNSTHKLEWSSGITPAVVTLEEAKENYKKTIEWIKECREERKATRDAINTEEVILLSPATKE